MSQRHVEQVIGKLVTDESFRHRFTQNPEEALEEMQERGIDLNPCERQAIASLDPDVLSALSEILDPRIQKIRIGSDA
jgi:hypothetical protein